MSEFINRFQAKKTSHYPSINNYYYDYTDLVEKLIDKYGTPTEQEENWVDKNSNMLTIYCDAEGYNHPQVYLIYTSPYYAAEAMGDNGL